MVFVHLYNKPIYYMASSTSGQDEPNCATWMTIRASKMDPSCPLEITRCIPQEKVPRKSCNKSVIDQVCSVKMAGYCPRPFFNFFFNIIFTTHNIITKLKIYGIKERNTAYKLFDNYILSIKIKLNLNQMKTSNISHFFLNWRILFVLKAMYFSVS